MSPEKTEGLKLWAADAEDLAVVAACLQDALVRLGDMAFVPEDGRFALVANRFCWENCDEAGRDCTTFERVRCGVAFDGVRAARHLGLEGADRDRFLDLLTIEVEDGSVLLVFAGGGAVRLEVERLACRVEDVGEPWPTRWRPCHPAAEGP